jgi:hypothetical protein
VKPTTATEKSADLGNLYKASAASTLPQASCTIPYIITLESITPDNGNYIWVWSVKNPNPGNGNNGTVQDLSHWDMVLNNCGPTGAQLSDIVSAGISSNGSSWSNFTPTLQQDPSIMNTCGIATGNVLKFNQGTSGSAKTYYRLVVSRDFEVNYSGVAYYKSGNRTKCGHQCFPGIGCEVKTPCSTCN